jgi:UDP-N-acetylglucosamine diphosphorylase / glucose-1-phosphate thymidylyltransferase / UDP-N-acetylgalactosamine diphosphorylase / glucosamine-1-phosphate N-acetyltransferase / galactosamine-1-phosphate N-acetyltransferase
MTMLQYSTYLKNFLTNFPELEKDLPWNIVASVQNTILQKIKSLSSEFKIKQDIAIHKKAQIEENVTLKGPIIISNGCFIGAHAYMRGGVYLGEKSIIGPGCEVKSSLIMSGSALAHFNFVGDSLIGSYVNMEAGSIIANHYNERLDKTIYVMLNKKKTKIEVTKFGALVGDHSKIGANAVLSPGTILLPESVVKRLELIEQC